MIKTVVLDCETRTFREVADPRQIDVACADSRNVVWVDVLAPDDGDYRLLAEEFRFHPLAIEDVMHAHQRPKIEEYKGYYFAVLYEVALVDGRDIELREVVLLSESL